MRLMKQPGSGLAWLACQLTASSRVAGLGALVRMWAMRGALALTATVDPAAGVATARVRGEFGPSDYARLRDDLLWVAANCPRRQLPEGCLLEVRSARPAVRNLLERAGWTGVRVMPAGRPEAERRCE